MKRLLDVAALCLLAVSVAAVTGCAPKADEQTKPETWEVSWTKQLAVRPSGDWFDLYSVSGARTASLFFWGVDAKTGEFVHAYLGEWNLGHWSVGFNFQNRPGVPTLTRMVSSKDNVKYVARGPFKSGCDPILEAKP